MTTALIPVSGVRQHPTPPPSTASAPQNRGYAACASYAWHERATRFALNRLTGRAQSLTDPTGWLLVEQA